MTASQQTGNRLLAGLSAGDYALLEGGLSRVELPVRKQLEQRNRRVDHVYFPESGLISVLAHGGADSAVEIGVIGKEGMTGMPVMLGSERASYESFVQIAGTGWRIEAEKLRAALDKSATLRATMLRFVSVMTVQMASAALANARFSGDARLARWLLMVQDRIEGPEVPLTHEFLALMLGTRRATVTVALGALKKKGIIDMSRKSVVVRNREGLIDAAHGSYGAPEAEYERLLERDTEAVA